MSKWNPSTQYRKVAEANRQYYAKTAQLYDMTETCVTDCQFQRSLEVDIDRILKMIDRLPATIRALDACGGSGNISTKLLKKGVDVTMCDISPDLLDIFRNKCQEKGFSAEIICTEIGEFLSQEGDNFDL